MTAADAQAALARFFVIVTGDVGADAVLDPDAFPAYLAAGRLVAGHRANPDQWPEGPIAAYGHDAPDDVRLAADLWAGDDPDLFYVVAAILRRCKAERAYPSHAAVMHAASVIADPERFDP